MLENYKSPRSIQTSFALNFQLLQDQHICSSERLGIQCTIWRLGSSTEKTGCWDLGYILHPVWFQIKCVNLLSQAPFCCQPASPVAGTSQCLSCSVYSRLSFSFLLRLLWRFHGLPATDVWLPSGVEAPDAWPCPNPTCRSPSVRT